MGRGEKSLLHRFTEIINLNEKCACDSLAECLAHGAWWTADENRILRELLAHGWRLAVERTHLVLIGKSSRPLGNGSLITFPYSWVFLPKIKFQRATFQSWLYRVNFWMKPFTLSALSALFCTLGRIIYVSILWWSENTHTHESSSANVQRAQNCACTVGRFSMHLFKAAF